jgi:hypothetical protein
MGANLHIADNNLSKSAAGEDKDDGCVPRVHGTPAALRDGRGGYYRVVYIKRGQSAYDIELVVRILRAGKSFAFV